MGRTHGTIRTLEKYLYRKICGTIKPKRTGSMGWRIVIQTNSRSTDHCPESNELQEQRRNQSAVCRIFIQTHPGSSAQLKLAAPGNHPGQATCQKYLLYSSPSSSPFLDSSCEMSEFLFLDPGVGGEIGQEGVWVGLAVGNN